MYGIYIHVQIYMYFYISYVEVLDKNNGYDNHCFLSSLTF